MNFNSFNFNNSIKIPRRSTLRRLLVRHDETFLNLDPEIGIVEDKSDKYHGSDFTFKQIGQVIQTLLKDFIPHKFNENPKFSTLTKRQTKMILFETVSSN